jgi:hypothetical protein
MIMMPGRTARVTVSRHWHAGLEHPMIIWGSGGPGPAAPRDWVAGRRGPGSVLLRYVIIDLSCHAARCCRRAGYAVTKVSNPPFKLHSEAAGMTQRMEINRMSVTVARPAGRALVLADILPAAQWQVAYRDSMANWAFPCRAISS